MGPNARGTMAATVVAVLVLVLAATRTSRSPLAFLRDYPVRPWGVLLDPRTGETMFMLRVREGHGDEVFRRLPEDARREGLARVDDRTYRSVDGGTWVSYLWSKEGGTVQAMRRTTLWDRIEGWWQRRRLP